MKHPNQAYAPKFLNLLFSLLHLLLNLLYMLVFQDYIVAPFAQILVYQFYNKGQTLGKKLFKIKVVSNDFKELTMDNYIYRSFIINSLLIDIIIFSLMIFASETIWLIGVGMLEVINYILLFICGFMVIFNKDGRGLHDLLGNTKVIQCRK